MKLKKYAIYLLPFTFFSVSVILFFFKLFFYFPKYVVWGNFYSPFTKQQLYHSSKLMFININGVPNYFPSTTIFNTFFSDYFIMFFTYFLPLWISTRVYFFISAVFLMISFYILSSRFTTSKIIRTFATFFFMYNPFQITQLAAGDFLILFYQGFLILSIFFMIRAINSKNKLNINWPTSFFFMFLTVGALQFSYLGVAIYIIIFCVEFYTINNKKMNIIRLIKNIFVYIMLLTVSFFLLFMPIILPAYFGPYTSLLPGSVIAQPLSSYSSSTTNIKGVLFLMPYPNMGTKIGNIATYSLYSYSKLTFYIWDYIFYVIIGLIFILVIFTKSFRAKVYLFIIIISSILGAGPHSLFRALPIYLYEHLLGYQLLNTSYYWDWIIIAPLYSIILLILLNNLSKESSLREFNKKSNLLKRKILGKLYKIKKPFVISLVIIIMIILIIPIYTQDYYNNYNGIIDRGDFEPSYANLSNELCYIENKNPGGVIFLPPGPEIYKNNTNDCNHVTFSYANFMAFREMQIPSYGSSPSLTSKLSYYIYNIIYGDYGNISINLGKVMSYLDMKYIVVLKNMTQYGLNSFTYSNLHLNRFTGIKAIFNNNNSIILESKYKPTTVLYSNSFMINIGNMFSISKFAKSNFEFNKSPIIFSHDINYKNFKFYLENTSGLIYQNSSYLDYLYLHSTQYKNITTTNFVNQTGHNHGNVTWVNGNEYYVPEISELPSSPGNFVFTCAENKSLNIKINGNNKYNMAFIEIYYSTVAVHNTMTLSINGKEIQKISPRIMNSSNNGFLLLPIHYNFNHVVNLTINSGNTDNYYIASVGNIFLTNFTQYEKNKHIINNIISSNNISVVSYYNASELNKKIHTSLGKVNFEYYGYSTASSNYRFTILNYPHYSDEYSKSKLLGSGMYTIIINSNASHIFIMPKTYLFWIYGTIIQLSLFVLNFLVMFFYLKKHKKY